MIIFHENLAEEASSISDVLEKTFNVKSKIINRDIGEFLVPMKGFGGYLFSISHSQALLQLASQGKAVLLLTARDVYLDDKSKEDDWVFGANCGNISIVSTLRLRGLDSKPSKEAVVPFSLYFKRLALMSVHEIGHNVVNAPHFREATCVNLKTGSKLDLGFHCTDNKCVMYEVIDINAPPADEGYLQLGDEKKYDAGVDDILKRLYPTWFCEKCLPFLKIDESYFE